MSENTCRPLGRTEAFDSLRLALGSLSDLAERLDGAEDDRERRTVLLQMVTAALIVRDRAAETYGALDFARDVEGLAKGVLE